MPVSIIESFQLGTDLPLDARYVVNHVNDISIYWYAGMQAYQTSNNQLYWYNGGTWIPVQDASLTADWQGYVDGSLALRDASINALSLQNSIQDASISELRGLIGIIDGSILYLTDWNSSQDASIENLFNANYIQDLSIFQLREDISSNLSLITDLSSYVDTIIPYIDGSLFLRDLSIHELFIENDIQDASIERIDIDIFNLDSSITDLDLLTQLHESSLGNLTSWNISQDVSIEIINSSIGRIDTSISQLNSWSAQLDASIQRIDASLYDYVRKEGDTMSGPLFIDSSLRVSGDATFDSDVDIKGDLRVDGSTTFLHTDVLDVSTGWIRLNTGLAGIPPEWLQSGIIVERGDASSFAFIYDETRQEFRIGIVGNSDASGVYDDSDTQAVATREDIPVDWAIPIWNPDLWRFDTSTSLVLDISTLITEYDISVNAKLQTEEFNVSGIGFPVNPDDGDMFYYRPLHSPFWYDASRGKWLGKKTSYGSGKGSANRNTDVYMDVGGGVMTSTDGILVPNNGVITAVSVSTDTIITGIAGRTMEFRINDSLTYNIDLIIPQGESKAYSFFENLDVSAGDLVQVILLANGADNVGNIIATFEITERP